MTRPAIHPGELLADELEEIGVSASELARQINVPPSRLSKILSGKQAITGDTALRLGHWFGSSAQFGSTCRRTTNCGLAEQRSGAETAALPARTNPTPHSRSSPRCYDGAILTNIAKMV